MQAALKPDELLSISQVSQGHAISRNHVMKVVNVLARAGFLETVRGRGGGFKLARPAETIILGDVIRVTEPNLKPVDCTNCTLQAGCGLISPLDQALQAFLSVLDNKSLADVAKETSLPSFAKDRR